MVKENGGYRGCCMKGQSIIKKKPVGCQGSFFMGLLVRGGSFEWRPPRVAAEGAVTRLSDNKNKSTTKKQDIKTERHATGGRLAG